MISAANRALAVDGEVISVHLASEITGFHVPRFFVVELRAKEPCMHVRGKGPTQTAGQCVCRSRLGYRLYGISGMPRKEST
jgi:hypothetical protein